MNEPIAYAAVAADGSESVYVASLKEQAEACCRENGWTLVPLYAAAPGSWQLVHKNERLRDEVARLRLTPEEREAIWAMACHGLNDPAFAGFADTLRCLLERTQDSHTTQGPGSTP